DVFARRGLQTQHFLSQACFTPCNAAATITGQCSRHLDSWVMSPSVCREIFLRGAANTDVGLIEGRYLSGADQGGRLGELCDWLELATIIIIDVRQVEACRLSPRPRRVDGVLLEAPAESSELARFVTHFETIWGVPVLGCLEVPD